MKSSDEREAKSERANFRKRRIAGRPNLLVGERLGQLLSVYYISLRKLADMFGVSRMTVWRAVQEPQMFPR